MKRKILRKEKFFDEKKETKELEKKIILSFIKNIVKNSKNLDYKTIKLIDENFWKIK